MPVTRTARALALLMALVPLAAAEAQNRAPDATYCVERALGRHFYCEDPRPATPAPEPTIVEMAPARTATEEMDAIRAQLTELRAAAVLDPTPQNVSAYIAYQRVQLDRASAFSDAWRRVLWSEPELDYTLQRPVSRIGKRLWLDTRKEDRERVLETLSERYGVFYFYAASCSACVEFSPILKAFSDRYGISVKAVSVDGGASPYFPDAVRDTGQMARLGLSVAPTPAVVLFDSHTRQVIPVGFGIVTQSELEERIFVLTQTTTGEDY